MCFGCFCLFFRRCRCWRSLISAYAFLFRHHTIAEKFYRFDEIRFLMIKSFGRTVNTIMIKFNEIERNCLVGLHITLVPITSAIKWVFNASTILYKFNYFFFFKKKKWSRRSHSLARYVIQTTGLNRVYGSTELLGKSRSTHYSKPSLCIGVCVCMCSKSCLCLISLCRSAPSRMWVCDDSVCECFVA